MLYKREVAGSSPAQTTKRSIRLMVRTAGFQPVNRSSILLWTANFLLDKSHDSWHIQVFFKFRHHDVIASHSGLKIRWSKDREGWSPSGATIFVLYNFKYINKYNDSNLIGKVPANRPGLQVRILPIVGLVNVLILIDIEISLLTSRGQVNGTNSEIQ